MVGTFAQGLPWAVSRRFLAGLSLTALVAVAGSTVMPDCAAGQIKAEAPPRPDPDGEYGEGLPAFEAEGPLIAVVSTGSQQIRVFDRNGMIASSKVSTGRKGYDTPEGVFSIIERKVEHNSNLYDDASMPFMQRITWSGVALHEGVVPGYRASHGCIRLPGGFAERLFRTTRPQTRVVIVPHDGVPLPLSHPVLFQPGVPAAKPAAAAAPPLPPPAPVGPHTLPTGDGSDERPMMLGGRLPPRPDLTPELSPDAPAAAPQPAPAVTAAELKARRIVAERKLAAATKVVEAERVKLRPRLVEQGQAEKAMRLAAALTKRTEGRAAMLAKSVLTARTEAAQSAAVTDHLEVLIELAQTRGREAAAREVAAEKAAAALAIQDHVKKLEAERQTAQNEARSIARKLSPVTVFVSRQTGRVYVRQATHPVMDLPVTIRDPGRPLGTHVFTAFDLDDRSEAVKWVAVSLDGPGVSKAAEPAEPPRRRKGEAPKPAAAATSRQDPLQAARAALDRIELPEAVLVRVMPALQPGSTLIISDLGQSIETGPGTDIVVQTKGEEQAIQNIASFVAKKKAEAAAQEPVSFTPSRRREGGWSRANDWGRW